MFRQKNKPIKFVIVISILITVMMSFAFTGCGKNSRGESDKTKAGEKEMMPYFSAEPTLSVLNLEYTYVEFGRYPQTKLEQSDINDDVTDADYDRDNNAVLNGDETILIHMEKSGEEYQYYYIEPVKWRIIETTDTEVMLWSDKVLDAGSFSKQESDVYLWSDSGLREWLNGDFYDAAFNDEEKELVRVRNYTNYKSAFGYPMRENDRPELVSDHTDDRVGIRSSYELRLFNEECPYRLSDYEEKELHPDLELYLKCESSDYALDNYKNKASGRYINYESDIKGYWTRTVVDDSDFAEFVDFTGGRVVLSYDYKDTEYYSNSVHNVLGVRPVIVLPLESISKYIIDGEQR
ncbi:MAG: hypothetical protein K2M78_12985 [Lachnospiraceae bacterium]|nr:hypothetical protein [Lachnospiraceae bacterium]